MNKIKYIKDLRGALIPIDKISYVSPDLWVYAGGGRHDVDLHNYNILLGVFQSLEHEPKFKVGDTIVDPTDSTFTFHIKKIEDDKYIESDDEWILIKEADENYRLKPAELSDDKKIGKDIIHYLEINRNQMTPNQDWDCENRWLPWLEMHRYSEYELENEYWRGYDDAKKEKQGEQKPVIVPKFRAGDTIRVKDSHAEYTIDSISDGLYHGNDGWFLAIGKEDDYELVEQKPVEWSEEDETTKNSISHIIRQYDKIRKRENQPCYYVGDCLLWMQNIKDRVQPQPKQEWSEEDEKNLQWLDTICERIYHRSDPQVAPNAALKLREWLKSLRPQKQWKPTEEQIAILRDVASGTKDPVAYGATMGVIIQGLEQLKAL